MRYCTECSYAKSVSRLEERRKDMSSMSEKTCPKCGEMKSNSAFAKDCRRPDGLYHTCNACTKKVRDAKLSKQKLEIVVPETKECFHCKEIKPSSDFKTDRGRKDGLGYLCRSCDKVRNDIRLAKVKENLVVPDSKVCFTCKEEKASSEFNKDSRVKDGLCFDCKECYNKRNNVRTKALGDDYIQKNRARASEYYKNNKEKVKDYQKQYNKDNHDKVSSRQLKYAKERYHTDERFRMEQLLRKRFRVALRRQFVEKKFKNTFDLLGISLDEFKAYFESKFTTDMTWARFLKGEIHIDHVIPCASFDLTKKEEQEKCFHYTNLQPLWAVDNLEKGARVDWQKEVA